MRRHLGLHHNTVAPEPTESLDVIHLGVKDYLDVLSPREYDAFTLCHLQGKTQSTVATCMGIDQSDVGWLVEKAVKRLRAHQGLPGVSTSVLRNGLSLSGVSPKDGEIALMYIEHMSQTVVASVLSETRGRVYPQSMVHASLDTTCGLLSKHKARHPDVLRALELIRYIRANRWDLRHLMGVGERFVREVVYMDLTI